MLAHSTITSFAACCAVAACCFCRVSLNSYACLGFFSVLLALPSYTCKFGTSLDQPPPSKTLCTLVPTLAAEWKDAICYFKEGKEVRVGRAYGRVCR